jgi:hypothetical protein
MRSGDNAGEAQTRVVATAIALMLLARNIYAATASKVAATD